jgi:hypothetical protein
VAAEVRQLVVRMATENRDWATRGFKERSPTWATTSGAGPSPPSSGSTALTRLPIGRSGRHGRSFSGTRSRWHSSRSHTASIA